MNSLKLPLLVCASLSLASCGGGDGGGGAYGNPADSTTLAFKGTVAIGAAVPAAVVSATCANGATTNSAPADAGGNYVLSIKAPLPCVLRTQVPNTSFVLRSMAAEQGVANVSPLTEAVTVFSGADFSRLALGKAQLATVMSAINSPLAGDPVTTAFVADETGLDKNILALTSYVANTSAGNPSAGPGSLAPLPQVLASMAASCTAAGDIHCTLTELALAKITSPVSKAIAKELLGELDKVLFVGAGTSLYERRWEPAFRESVERAYKYAVALLIERVGPAVVKDAGISKSLAHRMATSFKDDAMSTLINTPLSTVLEVLVSSAVGAGVDYIEEAMMPSLALDGSWGDAWKSLGFGAGAFALEVAAEDVLFCTFNRWACKTALGLQLVTLVQEVEVLTSWVYKDAEAFVDILRLNSSIEAARQRNLVMEELLSSYGSFTDPMASGAYTWATERQMSEPLASLMAAAIVDEKLRVPTRIGPNIDPAWRRQIQAAHLKRLDRLAAKFATIENTCRALKASEGQVGISKCLNLMNVSPPAPLSCSAAAVLRNGACVSIAPAVASRTFVATAPARLEVTFSQPMNPTYFTTGSYVPSSSVWESPTKFVVTLSSYTPGGTITLMAPTATDPRGFRSAAGAGLAQDYVFQFPNTQPPVGIAPVATSLQFVATAPPRLEVSFDQPMRPNYFTTGSYTPSSSVWESTTKFVITFSSFTPGGSITLKADSFVSTTGAPMASDVTYQFPANSGALLARWAFDDCTGTDSSGNGRNAVLHGAPGCVVGRNGQGLQLNGHDTEAEPWHWLELPANPGASVTFAAWIRWEPTNLGIRDESIWAIGDILNDNNYIGLWLYRHTQALNIYGSSKSVPVAAGAWTHVAVATDGQVTSLYVNGALADTFDRGSRVNLVGREQFISRFRGLRRFVGRVDDMRLYSRVMSPSEVQSIYLGN